MTTEISLTPRILLLGRCGLERVAKSLRERTNAEVTVAGWTQVELVDRLEPQLTYVDLFGWDTLSPLTSSAVRRDELAPLNIAPLASVVEALRGRRGVVFRGLRPPSAGAFGLLEQHQALNDALEQLRGLLRGCAVLDVTGLWARAGVPLDDVRFGMGHGEAGMDGAALEAEWLEALWTSQVKGPIKCLVLDLDDTLIHGQITDDDFHARNPAYLPEGESASRPLLEGWWRLRRGLHEAVRLAARRGIVLAMATRNDPDVVAKRWRKRPLEADRDPGLYGGMYDDLPDALRERAFLSHPQVLDDIALGPEDMVCLEAGFEPKSVMCRRIAERLGIGLDSLALLDNSPYERAEVTQNASDVHVIDADNVDAWRATLLHGPRFTIWQRSEAAARRVASYQSRASVIDAGESGPGLESFLHGLALEIGVRAASPADLVRVTELLQRTHQLNLTGHKPELDPAALTGVYVAWCRDNIADHGLISAGVFREGHLVSWVCSCRVLPHRVAASILSEMLRREPGAIAERRPTSRNGATIGLIEEAGRGIAAWVEVRRDESLR